MAKHGVLDSDDLALKRLDLHTKLDTVAHFDQHAQSYRLLLLELKEFELPTIDNYNNFLATLSPFPQFSHINLQYNISYPKVADKSFETYVTFIDPHHPTLRSLATSPNSRLAGSASLPPKPPPLRG